MGRKLKNILIRDLTDQDNETLRAIMADTGCYQASKALMRCAYSYLRMSEITKHQAIRIRDLELENHRLRSNAVLLAEVVKKNDLVLSKTQGQKIE
ncbi:hypothetical protein [Parabacteroides goldsteinii]